MLVARRAFSPLASPRVRFSTSASRCRGRPHLRRAGINRSSCKRRRCHPSCRHRCRRAETVGAVGAVPAVAG
eukprot:11171896-Lingulodinium_polyedra.AAC.1